jgi:hypothetical protein
MIILSILVFVMGVLCLGTLAWISRLNEELTGLRELLLSANEQIYHQGTSTFKLECREIDIKREIKDIKESMVGYEFALKTFEDYLNEKKRAEAIRKELSQ